VSEPLLVCSLHDLQTDEPKRVELADIDLVLVKVEDGSIYALEDVCSHAEFPLSDGAVRDSTIECDLHGSCFDLRTGKPTGPPASMPVKTFPVTIEAGYVHVELTN
jgi:3-phenylpropionate/trans-cinnamate dioxygenase ferredoxin subunit